MRMVELASGIVAGSGITECFQRNAKQFMVIRARERHLPSCKARKSGRVECLIDFSFLKMMEMEVGVTY